MIRPFVCRVNRFVTLAMKDIAVFDSLAINDLNLYLVN